MGIDPMDSLSEHFIQINIHKKRQDYQILGVKMEKIIKIGFMIFLLIALSSVPGQAAVCDVDGDSDVDRDDINLIFADRNAPADGPDDPKDADGNGTITVLDGRKCVCNAAM